MLKIRGFKTFSATDSAKEKVECIYRLLANDKLITPLPADGSEDLLSMKHKLSGVVEKQAYPKTTRC